MLTKICGLPIFLQDYEKGSNHSRSRVIATSSSEFVSYKVFQFSALLHSLISACLVKPIKKSERKYITGMHFFLSPHAFNNASFSSFDKICSHFCGVLRNLNSWCIFMLGLFERVAPLPLSAGWQVACGSTELSFSMSTGIWSEWFPGDFHRLLHCAVAWSVVVVWQMLLAVRNFSGEFRVSGRIREGGGEFLAWLSL